MEAVISTDYNGRDDHERPPASFSSTATLAAGDDEASMIPRRRGRGATFLKMTGALLFIAGSASVILTLHPTHLSSKTWSTFQQEYYPALQESLSTTLQSVPRLSREVLEGTKATAASMKTLFTAESAELAWEKSENAFHQLRHHSVPLEEEPRENMLGRALEGLEGIFHMRRRGANNINIRRGNGNKSNNLRKEGRNSKQQQRNMKKEASRDRRNAKADNHQANDPSSILSTKQEGEEQQLNGWMSLLSNSPLAAPLLAFCGIVFLVASLIMNLDHRRLHRERNTIILDEKEAEIVEFYERVECGTSQTNPFLEDVKQGADEHPIKRSSSERWMMNSERNLSDHHHHRSSSDSSLMRHHVIHPGAEMRENQCDLYYSRVLETLNYDVDDDEVDLAEEEQERMDNGGDDQECQQITILENIASLTNEEGNEVESDKASKKADCSHLEEAEDGIDTECFESAQSEEVEGKKSHVRCPQSPPSSSSSISSLTSEGYDIEAPFSGEHDSHQGDSLKVHGVKEASSPLHFSTAIIMPGPEEIVSRNLAPSDYSDYVSSTGATPQRSNLYHDRCQSLIENEPKLQRRVSFSPEVEIREIPTRGEPKANHEQHESYLYIMLFTVAITIIVFSLMPTAHPSLSPVYNTMTRGDIFQRAESILSSQWDVEL